MAKNVAKEEIECAKSQIEDLDDSYAKRKLNELVNI